MLKRTPLKTCTAIQRGEMANRRRFHVSTVAFLLTVLAFGAGMAGAAESAEKELRDDWSAMYLRGQRVGYVHTRVVEQRVGERRLYLTSEHDEMSLGRIGVANTLLSDSRLLEDAGGRLVSFEYSTTQTQGKIVLKQVVRGEVSNGQVTVTTGIGSNAQSTTVPAPKGLCLWAFENVQRAKGYEPGTTYSVPVFVPQVPTLPCAATVKVGERQSKEMFEITRWLQPVEVELSCVPIGAQTVWVDEEGEAWLIEVPFGGLDLQFRKVSKEIALQPLEKVEILLSTAILPDRPIPNPRSLERLQVLVTRTGESALPLALPSGPYQEVSKTEDGLRVTTIRAHPHPDKSYQLPYTGDEWKDLLKPTGWLEVKDPLIVEMSKEAVGGETDALSAALKIEDYVSDKITEKGLGLGFATALETARQKAGDCTEHAVLVAALARAAGIPSRVVTGLAYGGPMPGDTEAKFFYHMWAEVYVGEWHPLDAALGSHDATHIAMTRSPLDLPSDIVSMSGDAMAFLGLTAIKVLDVGEEAAAPASK